jgi:hypothetical protein
VPEEGGGTLNKMKRRDKKGAAPPIVNIKLHYIDFTGFIWSRSRYPGTLYFLLVRWYWSGDACTLCIHLDTDVVFSIYLFTHMRSRYKRPEHGCAKIGVSLRPLRPLTACSQRSRQQFKIGLGDHGVYTSHNYSSIRSTHSVILIYYLQFSSLFSCSTLSPLTQS